MYHLSETQIKKVAIKFLKSFYKDRPRQGNSTAGFDLKAAGNVTIDGYLSFPKENDKEFLATFEATSIDKQEEVIYQLQKGKLFLESFAIASAIALFGLAIALTYKDYQITFKNLQDTILYIGSTLLGFGLLAAFLINRAQRFRYIYAVEQFKRYHADDQWIVVADDVFSSSQDKYLLELKKQCIKNGFGLFSINQKMEGQLMIAPSKNELFANKRQGLSRFNNGVFQKLKVNKLVNAFGGFKKILQRKSRSTTSTNRFINYNYWPALTSFLTVLGIGSLFYTQLRDTSKVFVEDELVYRTELQNAEKTKETKEFIVDSMTMYGYASRSGIHGALSELDYFDDAKLPDIHVKNDLTKIFPKKKKDDSVKLLISVENGSYFTYDCERLFHFEGTNYILQDNVYKLWENAFNRIRFLKEKGIFAHAIQTSCFDDYSTEYIVFYEIIFDKKGEAEAAFPTYISELETAKIITSNTKIRELQF